MFAQPRTVLLLDNNMFLIPIAIIIKKPGGRQKRCLHQEIQDTVIVRGDMITALPVFLAFGQISFIKPEFCSVLAEVGAGTWFTLDM